MNNIYIKYLIEHWSTTVVCICSLFIIITILYENTKFKSFKAVYDFIAGKYYGVTTYLNILEEHGKLSIGRVCLVGLMVILFKWLWNFKNPGVMFVVLIIFMAGYVFFNKPILFNTAMSKFTAMLGDSGEEGEGSQEESNPEEDV